VRRGFAVVALIAVIVVVAAVVVFTMGGSKSAGPTAPSTPVRAHNAAGTIHGHGFTASVLSGWSLTSQQAPGGRNRYQLSSTGAPINRLGLPPAGTIGITIDASPSSSTGAVPTVLSMLSASVGTPRGAVGVAVGSPARVVRLAGVSAAEKAYTYTYGGFSNVQVDLVARHGGTAYLIELNAEPSLLPESQSALELLFSSWRWS
jgi:hypothetical protein